MIGPAGRRRERSEGRASGRAGRTARLAAAAGLAALALLPGAAAAGPRGRVVRVERPQLAAAPRLCVMGMGRGGASMCLGQPRAGERVALVDTEEHALRGELVIESVTEDNELASLGVCVSSAVRTVTGRITPPLDAPRNIVGLRGARLDPRIARVLWSVPPPSGRPDETVELAIDADGDGRADLIFTRYTCDAAGAPSASGDGQCIDTYMEQRGGGLRRALQESMRPCK